MIRPVLFIDKPGTCLRLGHIVLLSWTERVEDQERVRMNAQAVEQMSHIPPDSTGWFSPRHTSRHFVLFTKFDVSRTQNPALITFRTTEKVCADIMSAMGVVSLCIARGS